MWFGVFVLVSFIVCGLQAHKALSGTPALNGPFEMDGKFTKSHTVVARASVRLLLCVGGHSNLLLNSVAILRQYAHRFFYLKI